MIEYRSTISLEDLATVISGAERIALTTHAKPDGDAMGSVLAMSRGLSGLGKTIDAIVPGPVPPPLCAIAGTTPFQLAEATPPPAEPELIVVMDTGAWSQLEPLGPWLRANRERVVGIDHHARGDDVAPRRHIDTDAAATTQILVGLLDLLGCPLTGGVGGIAEALFVGLATDTGWFRFSKAESRVFGIAARLLEAGVNKSRLYQLIEETYRPQRLALEARALASVQYVGTPLTAVMSLTREDFSETGGDLEDLTGIVNTPMVVGDVRASVLLTELEAGVTKMSFRSKPAINGQDRSFMDVNELARAFGGGGHAQAAGARVGDTLHNARERLISILDGD